MFLACFWLFCSSLRALLTPIAAPPRHAKTRALQPGLLPSARAPIRSSRPAYRQPTVATPNIETAAALSGLQ